MNISSSIQTFLFGKRQLQAYVPDPAAVREHYRQNPEDFPYWSQVWPASLGLCQFLEQNAHYLYDKAILELAAGLGLPSLLAAQYSLAVHATDHQPEAVSLLQHSIDFNQFSNMSSGLLDWNEIPASVKADVLLLSDVNYDPWVFDKVYSTILHFLEQGTLIILSTPQRLMAKPFIERIIPLCGRREEVVVDKDGIPVAISIFVLEPALLPNQPGIAQ